MSDLIIEHRMDIFALQETWVSNDGRDDFHINSLSTIPGYDIFNVPRFCSDAHGGIDAEKNLKVFFKISKLQHL